jgi:hypothetical protein
LYDRRKRRPSPKRVPLKTAETVLQLYREKYFDFSVRHFHEKLVEEHGIQISYTWVKAAWRYYDLITIQDDATSEIYYAQLVEEEGTRTLTPAVREVIEQRGIFCAL